MPRTAALPMGVAAVMLTNIGLIFFYAPVERTMGLVQKIFYHHVASAWIGMAAFVVVFICSIAFLVQRQPRWDYTARASAELGTLFTTIVLVTGPLWARPVWNTWWTWDPRLTSTLIMWFMYAAYLLLQSVVSEGETRSRLAAIYGIAAFVNVPLVFFSIRWWRSLHPVVISTAGTGLTREMQLTLASSVIAFTCLYAYLLHLRVRMLRVEEQTALLEAQIIREET